MKTITHGANARDPLLHIEADGVLVNIRVGLTDTEGHRVTRVDISPDDESRGGDGRGHFWYQDGARIIRLHPGEEPPASDTPLSDLFMPQEIEALLRTCAELYDNSYDPGDYLSSAQQELAERLLHEWTRWMAQGAADDEGVRP